MEIVLYNNHYEFHFWAGLKQGRLAELLNLLPLGFKFRQAETGFVDSERGPGIFSLHRKSQPHEETPIPIAEANYLIRWTARASEGDVPRLAFRLAHDLSRELETRVWLVDAYGRVLRQTGDRDDYESPRSA